ncbi:MAG: CpsD/CapB family tyrosine-protein kinase [Clostridia bacterium]|nr:CpsD/CapB family tyrosine-protein kinase [Clostridia bacterium]
MSLIKVNLPGGEDFYTQEAYKVLRTNLQFCGKDIKVIVVTSHGENEGKTTVAMQTAKSFAELGKKVIVIDADMRKSVMAMRNTTAKRPGGLSEVLIGIKTLEECITKTQDPSFDILFAGKYPPNPSELLGSEYFSNLLAQLREQYDYVIIDTPPLGMLIDAAIIAPHCDGSVIVMGSEKLKYRDVSAMLDQMEKSGCRVLGVVRNKLNSKMDTKRRMQSGEYTAQQEQK